MESSHHFHHHQPQQYPPPQQHHSISATTSGGGGVNNVVGGVDVTGDSRFPQWSIQETKEFLMIRAELDQTFMETKRNKQLWEIISNTMKEKGFNRSAEQCKCKWKNLVTRYKGCETMEAEAMRQQFPFYNELQAIFTDRMQRMLWAEAEGGGGGGGSSNNKKKAAVQVSSEEEEEEESELGDSQQKIRKKRIIKKVKRMENSSDSNNLKRLKGTLEEFMRQQMQMEAQWMEAFEARENDRRLKELEWRQTMEALENQRILMEQRWRESEEQRRIREEARADKRDALITSLLNKLSRQDHQ
ncbi:Trihelix transcription factor GT-3b [Stylosanthes scabra]|uniref:Trihelix transcription factor GT-3b n=1 Tax=Stylosanthes scabra TaxID=79078 RepID=A0ABU6ZQW2_9FABA|nr:Trihelix transcription factor GT-3b [Stylosanthes scabra]